MIGDAVLQVFVIIYFLLLLSLSVPIALHDPLPKVRLAAGIFTLMTLAVAFYVITR